MEEEGIWERLELKVFGISSIECVSVNLPKNKINILKSK